MQRTGPGRIPVVLPAFPTDADGLVIIQHPNDDAFFAVGDPRNFCAHTKRGDAHSAPFRSVSRAAARLASMASSSSIATLRIDRASLTWALLKGCLRR